MNYFNLYPGDYTRDTGDLSLAEHGAYCLLLFTYYANDGDIPNDRSRLCRLCGAATPEEVAAVDTVIARFFPLKNGKFRNKKADKEIAKAAPRIRAARENGRKGGKKADFQAPPPANPVGTQWATQQEAHAGKGKGVGKGVGERSVASKAFAVVEGSKSPAAGRGGDQ